ncbi:uncharacterized protein THITE_2122302 [Thermothielavioides terrestris NRRL 8126]|uniref:Polyprenal reductase n=1 Tax=Thermothielavioides terrestris (strain ATCC 38088 / NRRL 8126) TaxID=578455 RepID=G2RCQ9_THETT|nr:uncharacterized protein THITE_2122302 [Thermothielavioides terrestris NRRL 8126]AEO70655.1 hypothetical protein THITE_2122302 [Thermothielavioides terrestris NRRL 8126]
MDPSSFSPAQWCQAFFFAVGLFIVSIHLAGPLSLKINWLGYGPRTLGAGGGGARKQPATAVAIAVPSRVSVPHSWFISFYYTSVLLSAFWAHQLSTRGAIAMRLVRWQAAAGGPSMTVTQVALLWAMMLFQGLRRLLECVLVMKLSAKSTMWVMYWVAAEGFYLCMSISVWIEGSGAILETPDPVAALDPLSIANARTAIALVFFLSGALLQNQSHRHLASLEKYSLPSAGMFKYIICPHYTAECLVYLGLALAAAPEGRVLNTTLLAALLFTFTNLAISAKTTRDWYSEKFGADKVAKKWNILPFVF